MKVLLLQDVYKLGRAGEVKKVANGYGRNYLIPQGLAMLATSSALKQAEFIKTQALVKRTALNQEMSGVAEKLADMQVFFPAKAGETDKLYGSITTQMVAEAISEKVGVEISRRQIDAQPLRTLGEHTVTVRLTMDLLPEVKVVVYRDGEAVPSAETDVEEVEAEPESEPEPEAEVETEAEEEPEAEESLSETDAAAE